MDLVFLLHTAFQNQGVELGILLGLRTRNDPIPAGESFFLLASTKIVLEDDYTPVKICNFSKPKEGKA